MVLGKLAVLERNKRTLIEDNDMLNKKHKEALKVWSPGDCYKREFYNWYWLLFESEVLLCS